MNRPPPTALRDRIRGNTPATDDQWRALRWAAEGIGLDAGLLHLWLYKRVCGRHSETLTGPEAERAIATLTDTIRRRTEREEVE